MSEEQLDELTGEQAKQLALALVAHAPGKGFIAPAASRSRHGPSPCLSLPLCLQEWLAQYSGHQLPNKDRLL